jgi:hypothetical protein
MRVALAVDWVEQVGQHHVVAVGGDHDDGESAESLKSMGAATVARWAPQPWRYARQNQG